MTPTKPNDSAALNAALRVAKLARRTMARFDHEAALAREMGETLPQAFWAAFGAAKVTLSLAERDVVREREKLGRLRAGRRRDDSPVHKIGVVEVEGGEEHPPGMNGVGALVIE